MEHLDFKGLLRRLGRSRLAAQVVSDLAGPEAVAELLEFCGYPGQPAGLAARLAADLGRGLPLRLDQDSRRHFGRFFNGPGLLEQARHEAADRLPPPPLAPLPASQISPTPEELAALWPWLSGQRFLRLARAFFLVDDGDLAAAALDSLRDFCRDNPPLMGPGWTDPGLLAVRAVNWLWGLRFLGEIQDLDHKFLPLVVLHLRLTAQTLGQALAPGEGLPSALEAGPAAALILLGRALPFLPGAESWLELGRTRLGPARAGHGGS